jgi:hypothetical protein
MAAAAAAAVSKVSVTKVSELRRECMVLAAKNPDTIGKRFQFVISSDGDELDIFDESVSAARVASVCWLSSGGNAYAITHVKQNVLRSFDHVFGMQNELAVLIARLNRDEEARRKYTKAVNDAEAESIKLKADAKEVRQPPVAPQARTAVDYSVVYGATVGGLSDAVKTEMRTGWQPIGGLCVYQSHTDFVSYYYQAMVKYA